MTTLLIFYVRCNELPKNRREEYVDEIRELIEETVPECRILVLPSDLDKVEHVEIN